MKWRYCITRENVDGGHWFAIREVYIDEDGAGRHSWTLDEIAASGQTVDEVRWALERMTEALTLPVLDISAEPPAWDANQ